MSKKMKIILASLVGVAVLAVGGVYAFILSRDEAEPEFTTDDLDDRLNGTEAPDATTGDTTADDSTSPTDGAPDTSAAAAGVDGAWTAAAGSEVGYRIEEVLGGVDTTANGRTTAITGSLTIEGTQATAAEFTVDMTTFASDSDRRDEQFDTRIMTVDQFPTATFVLTAPIDFGSIPAAGEPITASATGDLTLRGVTRSVTFELTAQVGDDGDIGVLGQIPIKFSDYEIPDPSNSFAVVKDNGLLEFILVFER